LKPDNQIVVIFGASGDLTQRKLIPAIFDLYCQDMLPETFVVLGVARTEISSNNFREKMLDGIKKFTNLKTENPDKIEPFLCHLEYLSIDTSNEPDYKILKEKLYSLCNSNNITPNFLFYLATPPNMYEVIPQYLLSSGLKDEVDGWRRIIIEKPFGYNLGSAQYLNKKLLSIFDESQIFRIDHYLGKETVQNLMVFRFSNGFFEPLWNRNYIHQVEITAAETIGIEGRGGYYDNAGAMRDMVQNHLLQLVALTAMEPPSLFDANSLRNETVKVFQALRPMNKDSILKNVVCGQYMKSNTNYGKLGSYFDEKGVEAGSRTETFVAMKFFIDNWRWAGVPFFIRTGKRLPDRVTEIVIHLKSTPHAIFSGQCEGPTCNKLIIRVQPDEGITMQFGLKTPGAGYNVKQVMMDFKYSDLADIYIPSAYERLILDCMLGDSTLYIRGDAVEATWKFIDPILNEIQQNPNFKIIEYPSCSWGPPEAVELMDDMWNHRSESCVIMPDDE
jgi:glucose-6-phosphate 1-dehydrogenase